MAIVKHIAVHISPLRLIRYVMNEGKTAEGKLVTGLSVTADPAMAYREMQEVFEKYSRERFYKRSPVSKTDDERRKEKVRLHHYIQSFAKGEITPEQAHGIGVEWARKIFGDNHQVIVSTHVDKSHVHNVRPERAIRKAE